jgi:tRNA pseudouridine13 synthase
LSGILRAEPSDFWVREQMPLTLTGLGEHLWIRIRKTGSNTDWVAERLAEHFGVARKVVSYAGRKDRNAVTEQWFCVHTTAELEPGEYWPGVEVLEAVRHQRKLRIGTHSGNEFALKLRGLSGDRGLAEQRLAAMAIRGVPNYFGEQRFGRQGANLDLARNLFAGRRLSRTKRSLALSSARSYLFNLVLAARVNAGCWDQLMAGDLANLDGSGSVFPVPAVTSELQDRLRQFDIHPSAPLVGSGGMTTTADALALERAVLETQSEMTEGLAAQGVASARRPSRCALKDFCWQWLDADALELRFSLPSGVFATSVVRELMRVDLNA